VNLISANGTDPVNRGEATSERSNRGWAGSFLPGPHGIPEG
jgi:hypothetical protein